MTVGGIERVTQVLSKIFVDYGHEVVIVTGPARDNEYILDAKIKRIVLTHYPKRLYETIVAEKFDVVIL